MRSKHVPPRIPPDMGRYPLGSRFSDNGRSRNCSGFASPGWADDLAAWPSRLCSRPPGCHRPASARAFYGVQKVRKPPARDPVPLSASKQFGPSGSLARATPAMSAFGMAGRRETPTVVHGIRRLFRPVLRCNLSGLATCNAERSSTCTRVAGIAALPASSIRLYFRGGRPFMASGNAGPHCFRPAICKRARRFRRLAAVVRASE